ncbi:fructokinase [Thiogranum longum]|uniref:Fructokinase n=1 Tax=Thiogranum longum TaxID=1537524 RepID=A0A4R1H5D9_9GAMM|nr:carbohydrate kinase [Thiogranum longum]TCK16934.1 fructokinase [Thiogranum longum]
MNTPLTGRPVLFGEVLFDHFPDGEIVLGGAPFNVAWHLNAFGVRPLLISRVGNDALGRRIRGAMQNWHMDTAGLQLDSAHPTGTVEVSIENDEPLYEIVEQRAWDFITADGLPPIRDAALLYHGSLALRSPVSRQALDHLHASLDVPVFVDVNLRPPWWSREELESRLDTARWVKLNDEELETLTPAGSTLEQRAAALQHAHRLELLITTRGAEGALAHDSTGRTLQVKPAGTDKLKDTVGAGDAFAAVIILGLLNDWDLEETLERAQTFASAIVGIRGATPEHRDFYTVFRQNWNLM